MPPHQFSEVLLQKPYQALREKKNPLMLLADRGKMTILHLILVERMRSNENGHFEVCREHSVLRRLALQRKWFSRAQLTWGKGNT